MSTQPKAEDLVTLPTLRPFTARLAAQLAAFAPPASIYIHAPTNISLVPPIVTHIIQSTAESTSHSADRDPPSVQQLLPKLAFIDLEEVHSTRQAFDRILNQLSGWECDNLDDTWDSQSHKSLNWDGRTGGLSVVKRAEKRRRNKDDDLDSPSRKKRRGEDNNVPVDSTEARSHRSEVTNEESVVTWRLSWDRAGEVPRPLFEPLRDTVEHFHHSLSKITALTSGHDAASFSSAPDRALNRWIVINHAEMLDELTVAGTSSGAGKETGLGMTLLGALLRTRELVSLHR